MTCTSAFLSGWLPGSCTTVPAMEDAFGGGADSCAPANSTALRIQKARASERITSVEEILPVQRVPLRRTEACIAYDAPQLFFGCAVGHACGADNVLLQHHRAHVVAAEAQAHLADFQSLGHPAGLHVHEIRKIETRNCQHFQVLDRGGLIPAASTEGGVGGLETPGDERGEPARLLLQVIKNLEVVDAVFDRLADA